MTINGNKLINLIQTLYICFLIFFVMTTFYFPVDSASFVARFQFENNDKVSRIFWDCLIFLPIIIHFILRFRESKSEHSFLKIHKLLFAIYFVAIIPDVIYWINLLKLFYMPIYLILIVLYIVIISFVFPFLKNYETENNN